MYADKHFFGFFNFSENDSKERNSFSYLSLSIVMINQPKGYITSFGSFFVFLFVFFAKFTPALSNLFDYFSNFC